MSQPELLARVVSALEAADVAYMITGSMVSSVLGDPRLTHDIDIVVNIRAAQIAGIRAAFSSDEYAFDEVAATEAIARRDQFQLLEYASGDKDDFGIYKPEDPHDRSMFERRHPVSLVGVECMIPTAEDLIVRKLLWAHEYESEKHFLDALGVFELQFTKLDLAYLKKWITRLRLQTIWQRLNSEAEPLQE